MVVRNYKYISVRQGSLVASYPARACAGVSITTGRVTIVIVRGFCMTYNSMDDKRRVYDSIRLPHIFLGSPGACACSVYQALSPPPLEGPGNEARFVR